MILKFPNLIWKPSFIFLFKLYYNLLEYKLNKFPFIFYRTIYHFDPSNPPSTSCAKKHQVSTPPTTLNARQQKYDKQKSPVKDYNRKFHASFEQDDQINTVTEKALKLNIEASINQQQTFYEIEQQVENVPEPNASSNPSDIIRESSCSPGLLHNKKLSNDSLAYQPSKECKLHLPTVKISN